MKIVKKGTMDNMFDFAYTIGRERLAKEQLEMVYDDKRESPCPLGAG